MDTIKAIHSDEYFKLKKKHRELAEEVIKKIQCSGVAMNDHKCFRHGVIQPACQNYTLCCLIVEYKEI